MQSTLDLVSEESPTFRQMTNKQRLRYITQVITVEPLFVGYLIPSSLCGPALQLLEFEKACRSDLGFSDTMCDVILSEKKVNKTYPGENDQIQTLVADMHSWQVPFQSVMPLILVLFLGSYSDRHNLRKPFMLIPIFGEFFAVLGCILSVVFMKQWPLAVLGIAQTVVPSFFGGPTMITMAAFAYIADVSTIEMRTLRVGVVQIVLNLCTVVAGSVSGLLFVAIGYYGVLSLAIVFYVAALVYGFFWIKEPKVEVKTDKSFLMDAFDPKHAIDTFNLVLKKKQGNNRNFLIAVLFIWFVSTIVTIGEALLFYFYVQKFFGFTPLEFTYFTTTNTVVHLVGTLAGIPIFTKLFGMSDLMILVVTFIDKIIHNVIIGLAQTTTILYLGVIVGLVTGISTIAIRSLATKIVSVDDLGKAQSLFGICEALGPALASPIYNQLYLATFNSFPAACFFFGVIFVVVCVVIVIWMYYSDKTKRNKIDEIPATNGAEKIPDEFQMTHM